MKEVNQQRVQDNLQGKAVEKVMLNSIKERVWKKHKQTQIRRRKIIKDVAPPSTYEIYTTNYTSRSIRNSFQLATPVAKPVDADPSNPGKTQTRANKSPPESDTDGGGTNLSGMRSENGAREWG